jgi:flagellar basal-body rod modification protein FlgD
MTTTTPVTSTTPSTSTSSTTGTSADALGQLSSNFSTFLTLLTTQLKNQDPTAPMDSNQFTQQLVMFSQVEQQINTNTNLQTLINQGTSQAGTLAATYLGKSVSVTDGNASLTNGQASWTYNLASEASSATLTVTDANGAVVYTGAGTTNAGSNTFNWNGTDSNGNKVADGTYKLAVVAQSADGTGIKSSVASAGVVSQIDMTSGTPQLVVGNMEIPLSSVSAIMN